MTGHPADEHVPSMPGGESLHRQASRLLLLNPGRKPVPVPEDWGVADLLDLIAPGGKISVCGEPGGRVIGALTRQSTRAAGPVVEVVAAGVCNPGEPAIVVGEAGGYLSLERMWEHIAAGGFVCLLSPRPGEHDSRDVAVDVRQRVMDWLDSLPATQPSS